ncbi:TPA: hypothetical protein QCW55_005634 [Bacillus cereus]|nr:hypothetical protein [Bacillus cereus]
MGWYSASEVEFEPHIGFKHRYNWDAELDKMFLLPEGACKKAGVPVLKDEKPVAFYYSAKGPGTNKYYGVYDRTNQVELFDTEDLGGFYATNYMARSVLRVDRVPMKLKKAGLLYKIEGWETVYDLSDHIEKSLPILKEKLDVDSGFVTKSDCYKFGIKSDRLKDKNIEILGFYLSEYDNLHTVYDVSETREFKAWKLKNLFK